MLSTITTEDHSSRRVEYALKFVNEVITEVINGIPEMNVWLRLDVYSITVTVCMPHGLFVVSL